MDWPRQTRYRDRIKRAFELIADNPLIARERPEVRPPIRLLPVFYDVIGGEVVIQRVLHHSMNWIDGL
jgi:toxin ParE1/3/4